MRVLCWMVILVLLTGCLGEQPDASIYGVDGEIATDSPPPEHFPESPVPTTPPPIATLEPTADALITNPLNPPVVFNEFSYVSPFTGVSGKLISNQSSGTDVSWILLDTNDDGEGDYYESRMSGMMAEGFANMNPYLIIRTLTYIVKDIDEDTESDEVEIWINGVKRGRFVYGYDLETYLWELSAYKYENESIIELYNENLTPGIIYTSPDTGVTGELTVEVSMTDYSMRGFDTNNDGFGDYLEWVLSGQYIEDAANNFPELSIKKLTYILKDTDFNGEFEEVEYWINGVKRGRFIAGRGDNYLDILVNPNLNPDLVLELY